MADQQSERRIVIHDLSKIPDFTSGAEEVAFWDTHVLSEDVWGQMDPVPEDELPSTRAPGTSVDLLFTQEEFRRISVLAAKRKTNPWKLLKEFVMQRLAEEEIRVASD